MALNSNLFEIKISTPYHASKKNDKRVSGRRTKSGKFVGYVRQGSRSAFIRDLILHRLNQWLAANPNFKTITKDVNAKMLFYWPEQEFFTEKGQRKQTLIDLSNAYQMIEDCLQKAKIIKNDSQICGHDGSDRLPTNEKMPFFTVELTEKRRI